MDCRGLPPQKNAHSKRKNYARSPSGNPKGGPAENYMQLSHFHQVRALCDMSMEQQVRDYLNHCPVSSEAGSGGALGPPPGGAPPPPPPGCLGSRILSRNANGTSEIYMDDGILENPSNVLNVTLQLLGRKKAMHADVTYTFHIRPVASFILIPEVNISVHKIVFLGMRARPTRIFAKTISDTCNISSENCIYKDDTDVLILTKLWTSCGIDLANWREIVIEATQGRL